MTEVSTSTHFGQTAEAWVDALNRAGGSLSREWSVYRQMDEAGVTDSLLDTLASQKPAETVAAARLCGALRLPESVPWLSDCLTDRDRWVRESAASALGKIGGRRAAAALAAAAATFPGDRGRLARALAQASNHRELEDILRRPLHPYSRATIALALGLKQDRRSVRTLSALVADLVAEPLERATACRALAMLGRGGAALALAARLFDPEKEVRMAACWGLKRFQPESEPLIRQLLQDKDPEVQAVARRALGRKK